MHTPTPQAPIPLRVVGIPSLFTFKGLCSCRYLLFLLYLQYSIPLCWIVFLSIQTFPGISQFPRSPIIVLIFSTVVNDWVDNSAYLWNSVLRSMIFFRYKLNYLIIALLTIKVIFCSLTVDSLSCLLIGSELGQGRGYYLFITLQNPQKFRTWNSTFKIIFCIIIMISHILKSWVQWMPIWCSLLGIAYLTNKDELLETIYLILSPCFWL